MRLRTFGRQSQRSNAPSVYVSKNFRKSVTVPLWVHLLVDEQEIFDARFSKISIRAAL